MTGAGQRCRPSARGRALLGAVLLLVSRTSPAGTAADLRCEHRTDPCGIDVPSPRLSWRLLDDRRGAAQTAYQVVVASRREMLEEGRGDLWDSGRVASPECVAVPYAGAPLASDRRYWWKVRVWGAGGGAGPWSEPATFLTGKLRPGDWRGVWIGADYGPDAAEDDVLGFAVEARRADEEHWVQVDLGAPRRVDRIVLHPMRHNDLAAGGWIDGYAFPVRFRLDVADEAAFAHRIPVADLTGGDFANPGRAAVVFDAGGRTARFVRLTATRLWSRGPGLPFVFTLGELQVFSGTNNVAAGAEVTASASVEGYGWARRQLTDGRALCPAAATAPGRAQARRHGGVHLRKEFDVSGPVTRAVLAFSGLGFSEAAIDGRKVGDYVIGPGFTDYDHRVPYLTFDVTDRFATPGRKRLDVTLVDGWYGLSRDPWVHQLEKRPYVDRPKLLLDLRLVHPDGTESVVASDGTWTWSEGEITRSWIAGEDLDLRRAGEAGRTWQPVEAVAAPRGRLEHQREPFNRIVGEIRPASVQYDAAAKKAAYDLGREVNGRVRFRTRGPAGTVLRITTVPTENRPRTSTFTLSGEEGGETYAPRFFHAGMRSVIVEGLAAPPGPDDLAVDCISSMRTPAGGFRCSDEYVNGLEQAVRRTVVNYTTFLPNDPVREWKAWTQDIQNMFGTAFYLFVESQTMYERWQHDLLDSQRADGNIANVAPGPVFDPYNSPWWGGCGVWLPWEWRLAYGDDAPLRDSYEAMKRYVDFLEAQAARSGGLQTWGLLDWLPVEETPAALINTPAHFHYARIVSRTAALLGRPDEAKTYADMAERVRETFNRAFLDSATGIYGEKGWKVRAGNWNVPGGLEALHEAWWPGDRPCTQAGQVMPLALGLVPDGSRAAVEAALLREIAAHKGRLSTGFVSTPYLLDTLADLDAEACWRLVTAREFPSWHSMTAGSGNDLLKETWAGGQALMPSLGGSVARWCHRALGGIRPDPDGPGFRRIILRPTFVRGLDGVECHHDSPYGRIVSHWRREAGGLRWDVTVPPGTTARVHVPAESAAAVLEGGRPAAQSEGVKVLAGQRGGIVFEVVSGRYEFTLRAEP